MSESETYCRECGRGSSAGHVLGCSVDREAQARRERIATAVFAQTVAAIVDQLHRAASSPNSRLAAEVVQRNFRENAAPMAVAAADLLIAELSK